MAAGCGGSGGSADTGSAVLSPLPPQPGPPPPFAPKTSFANLTSMSGIDHVFSVTAVPLTESAHMGGGLAAVDIDQDGLVDLYLVGGDGSANMLFHNDGSNRFSDVTPASNLDLVHLGSGPVFADIDGDNDLDLFVGSVDHDPIYLLRNDAGQFTDVTLNSGISVTARNTISSSFSDYDGDGDLDLFLAHWGNPEQPDSETLWQNNGDGTFANASIPSGIAAEMASPSTAFSGPFDFSFAPVFSDVDGDGDPDLLLASDFKTSKVFLNNGDATFTNTTDRDIVIDRNGMGNAVGDYDNDGDMDWFVTSIFEDIDDPDANYGNRLYRNLGNGTFEDVTEAAGVANGGWGWGACMEDFDNDGDLDIFHVNGWGFENPREPGRNDAYKNDQVRYFESQGDGTFEEAATAAGLTDTGQGRGVACFDSDRDGDVDIVITNNQDVDSVVFYRNDLALDSHYLAVRLRGNGWNTAGIGARIAVTGGSSSQLREIRAGNHYVSQNPTEAHFGLGPVQHVDVTVTWPDGTQTVLNDVAADQLLTIDQT